METFWLERLRAALHYMMLLIGQFQDIVSENPDKTGIFVREVGHNNLTKMNIGLETETGIYIYDAISRTILRLDKEYDNHYSISDNVIFTFCKRQGRRIMGGHFFWGPELLSETFYNLSEIFSRIQKSFNKWKRHT